MLSATLPCAVYRSNNHNNSMTDNDNNNLPHNHPEPLKPNEKASLDDDTESLSTCSQEEADEEEEYRRSASKVSANVLHTTIHCLHCHRPNGMDMDDSTVSCLDHEEKEESTTSVTNSNTTTTTTNATNTTTHEKKSFMKCVRFALEQNQHYPMSGSHYGNSITTCTMNKSVRFDLERPDQVYVDTVIRTEQEEQKCWYEADSLEWFREQANQDAQRLFLEAPTLEPQPPSSLTRLVSSLLPLRGQVVVTEDENENDPDTTAPLLNDAGHVLVQAYQHCQKAKSDAAMKHVGALLGTVLGHEQALEALYESDICGLEHFVLTSVRGAPAGWCAFVRQQATSSSTAMWAHVSSCVSRPSRLWAAESAKALEAVVRAEWTHK